MRVNVWIFISASADCTARCTCRLGCGSFISHSSRTDQRFHSSKTFFKKENTGNLKRWLAGAWMITSQAAPTCSQAARGCPPGWTCPKHLHLEARHKNSGPAPLFISPHSQTRSWVEVVTPLTQSGTSTLLRTMDWSSSQHEVINQPAETPEPLLQHSWQSPTLTRDEPDSLPAVWPKLTLPRYRDGPSLRGPTANIPTAPWQELVHNQGKILN